MRFLGATIALVILALIFGKTFFEVLGILTYALVLYLFYKTIIFHGRVLRAGRSTEHYSEEVVRELKALVKAIHVVKVRKR